ncbi:uncharacterized protein TNCT_447271 [Trichonephila clavata]|uniref:Uncharacterized protein n=1 Tax=Trichonephila clavata TaxID=2740835 RepID=A0A8X6F6W3_TRICU|nr:uncharacterized protein TNCT_447271 [Trichonephila clavata]
MANINFNLFERKCVSAIDLARFCPGLFPFGNDFDPYSSQLGNYTSQGEKTRILKTLSKLYVFGNGHKKTNRSSLRRNAFLACGVCLLFPLALAIGAISFAFLKTDKYLSLVKLFGQSVANSRVHYALLVIGQTILYSNHFFLFPGLVMVLLSFIYLSFAKTLKRHLNEMRRNLIENFSRQEMTTVLMVFTAAKKIHLGIEKTVSFVSFLSYVLIVGKIIQVISSVVTDFMSDEEIMNIMHLSISFTWAITWFTVLTMCGTQAKKNEAFIKDINQKVATNNFVKEREKRGLEHVNLLNLCSDIELRFTGWGMFVVDKKLFLTVTGVLVTYGVLFATEASKI